MNPRPPLLEKKYQNGWKKIKLFEQATESWTQSEVVERMVFIWNEKKFHKQLLYREKNYQRTQENSVLVKAEFNNRRIPGNTKIKKRDFPRNTSYNWGFAGVIQRFI